MTRRPTVAVIGPDDPDVGTGPGGQRLLAAATEVGAGLAAAGVVVVTGGLGGVMAAAARGARRAGGLVVGALPGTDPAAAGADVDVVLPTGLGQGRNAVVVAADVVVAVGGSWGTLSEVALARRRGRPVVSLDGWGVTRPPDGDGPVVVATAAEAVTAAVSRLSASPS